MKNEDLTMHETRIPVFTGKDMIKMIKDNFNLTYPRDSQCVKRMKLKNGMKSESSALDLQGLCWHQASGIPY